MGTMAGEETAVDVDTVSCLRHWMTISAIMRRSTKAIATPATTGQTELPVDVLNNSAVCRVAVVAMTVDGVVAVVALGVVM